MGGALGPLRRLLERISYAPRAVLSSCWFVAVRSVGADIGLEISYTSERDVFVVRRYRIPKTFGWRSTLQFTVGFVSNLVMNLPVLLAICHSADVELIRISHAPVYQFSKSLATH